MPDFLKWQLSDLATGSPVGSLYPGLKLIRFWNMQLTPVTWKGIAVNSWRLSRHWRLGREVGHKWAIAYFRMIDYELSMARHTWLANMDCRGAGFGSQFGANRFQ